MQSTRRGFLGRLLGGAAAVVAAPLVVKAASRSEPAPATQSVDDPNYWYNRIKEQDAYTRLIDGQTGISIHVLKTFPQHVEYVPLKHK